MSAWLPRWRVTNMTDRVLSGIELRDYFEAVSEDITRPIAIAAGEFLDFGAQPRADWESMNSLKAAIAALGFPVAKPMTEGAVWVEELATW